MLLRLTGFLAGAAGVSPALCEFLAARLNDGWTPVVPARGLGGAGEVIALSHLFQTLVGEGHVLEDGERVPAAAGARAPRRRAVRAGREGGHRARQRRAARARAHRVARRASARALLEHATLAGALTAALTGASLRPYSPRVGALKGDPGQQRIHAALLALHAGGADWSDRPQSPVSLRVLPQVHGAVLDLLDHVDAQVARELRAVTDSPLFLEAEGDEPAGSTRAATSTPRRSARARRARDRVRAGREPGGEAAAPAARPPLLRAPGPARGRPGPADRARVPAQVGGRLRRREPPAGRAGERASARRLGGAGGLPGAHVPGGGEARADPRGTSS